MMNTINKTIRELKIQLEQREKEKLIEDMKNLKTEPDIPVDDIKVSCCGCHGN